MVVLKDVEKLRHKYFGRAAPVESLARPSVELSGDGIEFGLCEDGQVGALWEALTKQAVGIFVDEVLPRAMGVGEIDADVGQFGQVRMLSHLALLVVGDGQESLCDDALEHFGEHDDSSVGAGVLHLRQGDEQRDSLDTTVC